jgi:O-antigen/teichoic acid export membrane protein
MVLTPFLAHVLGRQQFSEMVILNSSVWTSTVFMEFGFYLYGVTKTASATDRHDLSRTVTAITAGKVGLIPVAMAVYLALSMWSGILIRSPLAVAIGAFTAIGYGGSFAWFFQGLQRGGTAVITEAIPQIIYYAAVLSLVRKPQDLWLVALCQAIPPLLSVGIAVKIITGKNLFGRPNLATVKSVMIEALPYFVERFCFTLYTAITPTLVAAFSVPAEASYYSIGDRVGTFLGTLPAPIFQAAMPYIAKKTRTENGGWRVALGLVAGVTLLVGVLAGVTFLMCDRIISRFFSTDFRPAIPVAHLFCLNAVIAVLGLAIANFVIIPRNSAQVMIWSSTTALVIGIILQSIMIPRLGALGAVISRCTSESVVVGVLGIFALRLFLSETRNQVGEPVTAATVDV